MREGGGLLTYRRGEKVRASLMKFQGKPWRKCGNAPPAEGEGVREGDEGRALDVS